MVQYSDARQNMEICGIIIYLFAMIFRRRKFQENEPWGIDDDLMFFDDFEDWG